MTKKVVVIALLLLILECRGAQKPVLKNGDIIFHVSRSSQSKAIQYATGSQYSHMGIIFIKKKKVYVCEAIQPVTLTPLHRFIARGRGGHYTVKRLKNVREILTPQVVQEMYRVGAGFLGKNYDYYFAWSDRRIYCSELVWKIYKRAAGVSLTRLKTMSDFDLTHPLVKKKIRERYGRNIPLNEKVVSPADIYTSTLLDTVY
jgi:hypothetical protein